MIFEITSPQTAFRRGAGRRGTVFNTINNFLQNLFIPLNIYTFAKSGVTYGQFVRETY